uniref:B30.2/SPRY domain-containing protein n=1 Tax=Cyprinus carpio TaxID=7962 RepID=A0A8C1KLU6_CYPCA
EMMEEQQKAAEKQEQVLIEELEQEITELQKHDDVLNSLNIILRSDDVLLHGDIRPKLPDKPERFDPCPCVLGKEGFSSGRFYFEVQVKGKTDWDLGVARESINRKGTITLRPRDGYWTVWLRNRDEYKTCDDPPVSLSLRVKPQRVGVFVDYEEGLVSFYDVESSSHIYSFTARSFTEKLYPYFSPSLNYGENLRINFVSLH